MDLPNALQLLEREHAFFHDSLKGIEAQAALALYGRRIEQLELKLRKEKLECEECQST